ncbi:MULTISPECIES: hypothetical protein [unclassified Rathayibacter]|uniref:hypothetical protein n=1 Tax=unclassified Rathayibacter TaxID=2609250 RepID=UPI0006F5C1D8|nr:MULTISPECIES: hypothetical protein [unclassified Rathayibacter]KQQ06248.1 hypothetical protein ASF42_06980 [Rathayibacter sp. Leaf294]KQS14103.1 hypothetical protein ASG06_06980 [Rathayibacter sp. Leaf185]
MKQTRAAAVLLTVLALAGCTAPAPEETADSSAAAREESRDRVTALVESLTGPQVDTFAFAREASDAGAEGVDLIGIASYDAETPEGAFGTLSFRTPVDATAFPDAGADAFCFEVYFSAAGPVASDDSGDGTVGTIECPDDATVITPPPAEG